MDITSITGAAAALADITPHAPTPLAQQPPAQQGFTRVTPAASSPSAFSRPLSGTSATPGLSGELNVALRENAQLKAKLKAVEEAAQRNMNAVIAELQVLPVTTAVLAAAALYFHQSKNLW